MHACSQTHLIRHGMAFETIVATTALAFPLIEGLKGLMDLRTQRSAAQHAALRRTCCLLVTMNSVRSVAPPPACMLHICMSCICRRRPVPPNGVYHVCLRPLLIHSRFFVKHACTCMWLHHLSTPPVLNPNPWIPSLHFCTRAALLHRAAAAGQVFSLLGCNGWRHDVMM